MSAEAHQQVLALLQRGEEIEAAKAAARALAAPVLNADHKGGAGEPLGQAGGHNARDPLVPRRAGEDQGIALLRGGVLGQGRALLENLQLDGLALPVEGKVWNVDLDDWMFLINDKVMLNRSAMSKFGIHLGDITLSFTRR